MIPFTNIAGQIATTAQPGEGSQGGVSDDGIFAGLLMPAATAGGEAELKASVLQNAGLPFAAAAGQMPHAQDLPAQLLASLIGKGGDKALSGNTIQLPQGNNLPLPAGTPDDSALLAALAGKTHTPAGKTNGAPFPTAPAIAGDSMKDANPAAMLAAAQEAAKTAKTAPNPVLHGVHFDPALTPALLALQDDAGGADLMAARIDGPTTGSFVRLEGMPAHQAATQPQVPLNAVALHVAQQALNGNKRFQIKLDPPELGRIDVQIDVGKDGRVATHMMVERAETLDFLMRDARALERALTNAGLDTQDGDLKFSLRDQDLAQQGGEKASGGDESTAANAGEDGETGDMEVMAALNAPNIIASDRIDISV